MSKPQTMWDSVLWKFHYNLLLIGNTMTPIAQAIRTFRKFLNSFGCSVFWFPQLSDLLTISCYFWSYIIWAYMINTLILPQILILLLNFICDITDDSLNNIGDLFYIITWDIEGKCQYDYLLVTIKHHNAAVADFYTMAEVEPSTKPET